jgi:hypothetical protein
MIELDGITVRHHHAPHVLAPGACSFYEGRLDALLHERFFAETAVARGARGAARTTTTKVGVEPTPPSSRSLTGDRKYTFS